MPVQMYKRKGELSGNNLIYSFYFDDAMENQKLTKKFIWI